MPVITVKKCRENPTCEEFSRLHKGGPNGCTNPSTLIYWAKVKECRDLPQHTC